MITFALQFAGAIILSLGLGSCAFIPRQVDLVAVEERILYPRDTFAPRDQVKLGPFEDRRPNPGRLGVGRNKLMMVTTTVGFKGDLATLLERMVRQSLAANGIGEGPSPYVVRGAVLEAVTDAHGPDHVFVTASISVTVVDSRNNTPVLHRVLRGHQISPVTQMTDEAWEDAFIGAFNQIAGQIQVLAADGARALNAVRQAPPTGERTTVAGSCVTVRDDGLLLTAHHVVGGVRDLRVRLTDGRVFDALVTQADPANDLALLKIPATGLVYLPLAPARSSRLGQRVFTVGFPVVSMLGAEPRFTEGSISALTGPRDVATLLQVSVPIQPGNSGGPLVSESGDIVGVITSTASAAVFLRQTGSLPQNVNWAVKAEYARPLFDAPAAPPAPEGREEAIDRARSAACLVLGEKGQ